MRNIFTKRLTTILLICMGIAAGLSGCATVTSDHADVNKDGIVSAPEFESALLDAIIRYGDSNGDGSLNYSEWEKVNDGASMKQFDQRDLNGDGYLDRNEALKSTRQSELWHQILLKIDLNGDQTFDENEIAQFRERLGEDDGNWVNRLITIAEE